MEKKFEFGDILRVRLKDVCLHRLSEAVSKCAYRLPSQSELKTPLSVWARFVVYDISPLHALLHSIWFFAHSTVRAYLIQFSQAELFDFERRHNFQQKKKIRLKNNL